MKKIFGLCVAPLLLLLAGQTLAAPVSSKSLDQLLELSGINKQFANIPGGVMMGVQQAKQESSDIPAESFSKIEEAVSKGFQPTAMLRSVNTSLKKGLNEREAQELLAWYNSELGRKITRAEENASDPAAIQEMMSGANELMADSERVALAQKIDQLVKGTEATLEIQKSTAKALYTSMVKLSAPKAAVDYKPFEESLARSEQQIRAQLSQLITLSYLYTYKSLTTEEIGKYIAFLEKPTTQKFTAQTLEAIKVAFNASVVTMSDALAASLVKAQ